MPRTGLVLEPLDTLFFRDGRPFENATRASSGLPVPQTLAGALRTFMLRSTGFASEDFKRLRDETISGKSFKDALGEELGPIAEASFRGPWLALIGDDGQPQPLFPCPSTLLKVEADDGVHEQILRLDPLRENEHLQGWSDAKGMRPLWRHIEN